MLSLCVLAREALCFCFGLLVFTCQVITLNKSLASYIQRWTALKPRELATWSTEEVRLINLSIDLNHRAAP